jgi:dihydroorotate dehydrogenase electron transfer subunit
MPHAHFTEARVIRNPQVCREHRRLVLAVDDFHPPSPGQFVHIVQPYCEQTPQSHLRSDGSWVQVSAAWAQECMTFRRAFSIAAVRRRGRSSEIDLLYRVVGTATRWMASLTSSDPVDLLGPLGNGFTIAPHKQLALLVAGGVGLPPMLAWAAALAERGVRTVALCGAQSADLFPLALDPRATFNPRDTEPASGAEEFDALGVRFILTTDDGTLGMRGRVTDALARFVETRGPSPPSTAIYTCGPEPMMRRVAELACSWDIDCQVCMERSMACGLGTCQSCVVPIRDGSQPSGFRYQLCCTQGPVFDGRSVIWNTPPVRC